MPIADAAGPAGTDPSGRAQRPASAFKGGPAPPGGFVAGEGAGAAEEPRTADDWVSGLRRGLTAGWERGRRALLASLYPAVCPGCNGPVEGRDDPRTLCEACGEQLEPVSPPYCLVCGEPFPLPTPAGFRCGNCRGRSMPFEFAIAPYVSEDLMLDLIHRFKYHRDWPLRQPLARLMLEVFDEPRVARLLAENRRCWLVPVPIHWRRERHRGYNQAALLATALADLTGLPVSPCLRRTRATPSQAMLNRSARVRNLRGAFAPVTRPWVRTPQPGDRVLLVDDVLTTGTTASACSRLLKRHFKVDKVVVITAARG